MKCKNNESATGKEIIMECHNEEKMDKLNASFLKLCEKHVDGCNYKHFMNNYKRYVDNIELLSMEEMEMESGDSEIHEDFLYSDFSVDNSVVTNQLSSDLVDDSTFQEISEGEVYNKKSAYKKEIDQQTKKESSEESYQYSSVNKKKEAGYDIFNFEKQVDFIDQKKNGFDQQHVCSKSQIYKFLVHFYGVECPNYKKFHVKPLTPPKKPSPYDWPFLDVPTKPRSVFDTGPTREEVGEYNRRIFDMVTQKTFTFPREIIYRFNPNFFDEDSDESLKSKEQLYKSDVEIYTYDGDVFVYNDCITLRIYLEEDLKMLSLRNIQGDIKIDSEIDNFKFVTDEHGEYIDILFLENFTIYRLLFRGRLQVERVMRLVADENV